VALKKEGKANVRQVLHLAANCHLCTSYFQMAEGTNITSHTSVGTRCLSHSDTISIHIAKVQKNTFKKKKDSWKKGVFICDNNSPNVAVDFPTT